MEDLIKFEQINTIDDNVHGIAIHPSDYKELKKKGLIEYAFSSNCMLQIGKYGRLKNTNADIYISTILNKGDMCILSCETIKSLIKRQANNNITVLPADKPRKRRLGWIVYEEVYNTHDIFEEDN